MAVFFPLSSPSNNDILDMTQYGNVIFGICFSVSEMSNICHLGLEGHVGFESGSKWPTSQRALSLLQSMVVSTV